MRAWSGIRRSKPALAGGSASTAPSSSSSSSAAAAKLLLPLGWREGFVDARRLLPPLPLPLKKVDAVKYERPDEVKRRPCDGVRVAPARLLVLADGERCALGDIANAHATDGSGSWWDGRKGCASMSVDGVSILKRRTSEPPGGPAVSAAPAGDTALALRPGDSMTMLRFGASEEATVGDGGEAKGFPSVVHGSEYAALPAAWPMLMLWLPGEMAHGGDALLSRGGDCGGVAVGARFAAAAAAACRRDCWG